MAVTLAMQDYTFGYGSFPVLTGITIDALPPGTLTAIVGPNATGKSTLFKCIAGLLTGRGAILLDGQDTRRLKRAELTRQVTYLPQNVFSSAVLTVFEAVLLARQVSATWRVSSTDLDSVGQVLAELGIEHLALRHLNELSGGQRQIVSIAQALIRDPEVLLLDEPTSSLDLHHQLEVLEIVRAATTARGMTTLIALHDLSLAGRYADHFIVLAKGAVYNSGAPADVLTPELLRDVYHVDADIWHDNEGHPVISPRRALRPDPVPALANA